MDRYVETVQEKRLIGLVNPMCVLEDHACGNQKDFQRSKCDYFLQQAWHQSFRDSKIELLSHVALALMPRLEPNRVKLVLHTRTPKSSRCQEALHSVYSQVAFQSILLSHRSSYSANLVRLRPNTFFQISAGLQMLTYK